MVVVVQDFPWLSLTLDLPSYRALVSYKTNFLRSQFTLGKIKVLNQANSKEHYILILTGVIEF